MNPDTAAPTGATYRIGAVETLLGRLEAAGILIDDSCRSGTCGAYELRARDGAVLRREHRRTSERRGRVLLPGVPRADRTVTVGPSR